MSSDPQLALLPELGPLNDDTVKWSKAPRMEGPRLRYAIES